MTSEVVILNRKGLVLAADSAVTTSGVVATANHPRYSKAANKIFDLTPHGAIALTIFGNAHIDRVPWELAAKLFRSSLVGQPHLPRCEDYLQAVKDFLNASPQLFPTAFLNGQFKSDRFGEAAAYVLRQADAQFPDLLDQAQPVPQRQLAWQQGHAAVAARLAGAPVHPGLSQAAYQQEIGNAAWLVAVLTQELAASSSLAPVGIPPQELANLTIEAIYKEPTWFLSSTGLVVAGYGNEEIFPSYRCVHVYGHVGTELLVVDESAHKVTHDNGAHIQAFAKSSMIDVFTRGVDYSLWELIRSQSASKFQSLVDELRGAGIVIPDNIAVPAIDSAQQAFMAEWVGENTRRHLAPLRQVLDGLGMGEMSELAETLLVLESLKERVTSPSESVGGPIDVAAITKAEGLVWIKRKHFFDPALNLRFVSRAKM